MKLFKNMNVENGCLSIGGIKATDLVREFKSPLYVMDEDLIRNNCKDYYTNFKCYENKNRVAFAGKAFLTKAMCNLINEEGLYLDVVSGGELYTAYKAGFPLDKVYFHGNNKTLDEIELGVKLGVGRFVVDNLYELEKLNKFAGENDIIQKIYLRITPGIEAHTHEYIKTGQIDSKFGFAPVENIIMDSIKMAIELENIELAGLHCHIGSQIFDVTPFEDAAEVMLTLINDVKKETGYVIKELDLGGGFGIYYSEEDAPRETREYCEAIINKVDKVCRGLEIERPILSIEPGRSIVGNAGTTLYTVGSVKTIPGVRTYVAVDGGMTDNIRPALYQANYECAIANKMDDNSNHLVTIAGKCCESGDLLLKDTIISIAETGDTLAVFSTGAYGYSMSNNYNRIGRPAVVFVNNGEARVVCKRESYDDLIRNDL